MYGDEGSRKPCPPPDLVLLKRESKKLRNEIIKLQACIQVYNELIQDEVALRNILLARLDYEAADRSSKRWIRILKSLNNVIEVQLTLKTRRDALGLGIVMLRQGSIKPFITETIEKVNAELTSKRST